MSQRPRRQAQRTGARQRAVAVGALTLLIGLAGGCGSKAGDTTCAEFAQMSPHTGLMTSFTSKQNDVLRDMLDDAGKDTSQVGLAGTQVIAYCNIYNGHAGSNADSPISGIPGLQ